MHIFTNYSIHTYSILIKVAHKLLSEQLCTNCNLIFALIINYFIFSIIRLFDKSGRDPTNFITTII
jgi:hypothetical protein